MDFAGQRVAVDRRLAFEGHRHRHLHVHGPGQLVAVDLAILDVERTHGARILPCERIAVALDGRSEEHTSELQSLMRISYAVFCLTKKNKYNKQKTTNKHKVIYI